MCAKGAKRWEWCIFMCWHFELRKKMFYFFSLRFYLTGAINLNSLWPHATKRAGLCVRVYNHFHRLALSLCFERKIYAVFKRSIKKKCQPITFFSLSVVFDLNLQCCKLIKTMQIESVSCFRFMQNDPIKSIYSMATAPQL